MSGYFGHSFFPLYALSQWVRYWLLLRLYPKKIIYVGKKPYLTDPLTGREKATIFGAHLVLLAAIAVVTILVFLGVTKLTYG